VRDIAGGQLLQAMRDSSTVYVPDRLSLAAVPPFKMLDLAVSRNRPQVSLDFLIAKSQSNRSGPIDGTQDRRWFRGSCVCNSKARSCKRCRLHKQRLCGYRRLYKGPRSNDQRRRPARRRDGRLAAEGGMAINGTGPVCALTSRQAMRQTRSLGLSDS
jgi:hypothetical protein